ncbi:TPA: hypothetical protein JLN09_001799 [Escherichia coli]|nr:hypothetical protein [Escherichia coli]
MSDSLSNKELVAVGHHLAKAMSSDTPIIDIAKIVSRLAERLDCTTAALHATQAQRDQLAAENGVLKITGKDVVDHWRAAGLGKMEVEMMKCMPELRKALETPATDAFLAEVGRTTVTLPTGYSVRPGHPINETERSVMIPKGDGQWLSRFDVEHALRMAGISIKGE